MHRRLPPLNALKAFEATARLGSEILAAAELHVTRSAVSQQIRKLEDFLGKQLFVRHNNQLVMTDVGLSVFSESTELINRLAAMTDRLLGGELRAGLTISVLPSLAARWLNQRLGAFLRMHPDVRVALHVEDDPVDFVRSRIDVRISFGEHLYPELVTVPFLRDHTTAMCTPKYARARRLASRGPEGLRDEDLIHVAWRSGFSAYPSWSTWFGVAGRVHEPRRELGHTVDMSSLALDLAVAGAGVALGQHMFAAEELRLGTLVTPFSASLPLQHQYCAVYSRAGAGNPAVQVFVQWLAGAPAMPP
jgi:LysR family glycine cleavage system transcriptional activator